MCKTNQFAIMPFESCNKRHQCFSRKKKGFTGQGKIHLIYDVITHVPEVCRDMSDVGRKPPKC